MSDANGAPDGADYEADAGSPDRATREVLLVVHASRGSNLQTAREVADRLTAAGIRLRVLASEWAGPMPGLLSGLAPRVVDPMPGAAEGCEMVLVLGGDGTLLRAAELARPSGTPLLGVNLGRVGFLAEAEVDSLDDAMRAVAARAYRVEERMTLEAVVSLDGVPLDHTWALNEACVEKTSRERILEVVLEVDGRPVSGFGCDGVLCSTPTGSTAYAFSAGGPVVWPEVRALLVVPLNAHALFARPLVISPSSHVGVEVDSRGLPAVLVCDGRRTVPVPAGARVEVSRGELPVRLVRLSGQGFGDRLVRKFSLPVQGWRGAPSPSRRS